jgi:hypothetical protein
MKNANKSNLVGFETGQKPGPFTDLIASASVIARLELLRRATPIFGWTIDIESVSALIAEAKELNEASARFFIPSSS